MTPRRPQPVTYQCPVCKGSSGDRITILVQPHDTPKCTRKHTKAVVMEVVE